MAEVTKYFYSNCFIEAMKAKLLHPFKVKITYIRPKYGESFLFVPCFLWSNGTCDFDFGVNSYLKPKQVFFFRGCIRMHPLGYNKEYKAQRIKKYHNKKAMKK